MVLRDVGGQALALAHCELLAFQPDKLRPAETEGAVGVAGLPLGGEEQHCLAVFVLHAFQRLTRQLGHVVLHLAGRVRIQSHPNLIRDQFQLARVFAAVDRRRHAVEIRRRQHPALRECQPEHPVCERIAPIDQMVHHVAVGLEGQHAADDVNVVDDLIGQRGDLRQLLEVM